MPRLGSKSQNSQYFPVEQGICPQWDVETDVVVAGFGAAGFAASVTAHELGAKIVILEKAPEGQHGGNTWVAGQGYLNTSSADETPAFSGVHGADSEPETTLAALVSA